MSVDGITTYQQLLIVSMCPIPYIVIMSWGEPPTNQQMAHASWTLDERGPFGTYLAIPF
jgi:hypothetical protein